jgi:hypothetical protein
MATIGDQLQAYRNALVEAQVKDEQSTARKIEQQIKDLEVFQKRHPEEGEAPSFTTDLTIGELEANFALYCRALRILVLEEKPIN